MLSRRSLTALCLPLVALVSCRPEPRQAAASAPNRDCSSISDPAKRLACFDGSDSARPNSAIPAAAPETVALDDSTRFDLVGKWRVSSWKDPIDDRLKVTVSLDAEEASSPLPSDRPTLIIRCFNGQSDLLISWSDYLGWDDPEVTVRLDAEKATTRSWTGATSHTASFYPGNVATFVRSLFGKGKLVARVTPYSEGPKTAAFELDSLEPAIEPLAEACAWPGTPAGDRRDSVAQEARLRREAAERQAAADRKAKEDVLRRKVQRIELTRRTAWDTLYLDRDYFRPVDIIRNVYDGLSEPMLRYKVRFRITDASGHTREVAGDPIRLEPGSYEVLGLVGDSAVAAEYTVPIDLRRP